MTINDLGKLAQKVDPKGRIEQILAAKSPTKSDQPSQIEAMRRMGRL